MTRAPLTLSVAATMLWEAVEAGRRSLAGNGDMPTLALVLEEGFDGDEVTVRVGDDVVFSSDSVTTRPQVGVAQRATLDLPPGEVVLSVDVTSLGVAADVPVEVRDGTHLGISIVGDQVVHRTAGEPFRYA